MTCAVSAAVREGAEAVVCASTGNTAASAAAYAARAGLRGVVIVPEGKIADRQARSGADARRPGRRDPGQLRRGADARPRARRRHPISLVNSVNEFRIEGQKTAAFEIADDLGDELDALCIPVGNAGNITAYWRGFNEIGLRADDVRLPGGGRRAAGQAARPIEHPETVACAIRIGNPARWEQAMDATISSGGASRRHRRADPRRLQLPRRRRGRLLRAGVGGERCRVCSRTAPRTPNGSSACLTGQGLKDPDTALSLAGGVIPCEPEIGAIERAILR